MDFLKKITDSAPKTISGATGTYFRVSEQPGSELYVKFAFVGGKSLLKDGNILGGYLAEINLLLIPKADSAAPTLSPPLAWIRDGKYKSNGIVVRGFLVAKLIVPTPFSSLNSVAMGEYLTSKAQEIQDYIVANAVDPLDGTLVTGISEILDLIADKGEDALPEVIDGIYPVSEYSDMVDLAKAGLHKKFADKATPVDDGDPSAD